MAEGVVKRGPEYGRIVITLEHKVSRENWPHYRGVIVDAVDALRQDVKDYQEGALSLADLIESAEGISVEATK